MIRWGEKKQVKVWVAGVNCARRWEDGSTVQQGAGVQGGLSKRKRACASKEASP